MLKRHDVLTFFQNNLSREQEYNRPKYEIMLAICEYLMKMSAWRSSSILSS